MLFDSKREGLERQTCQTVRESSPRGALARRAGEYHLLARRINFDIVLEERCNRERLNVANRLKWILSINDKGNDRRLRKTYSWCTIAQLGLVLINRFVALHC